MAERGRETVGALGVDNLIEISEESESESEEEEDQLRESRLGQLRGSSSGGDVAVSGNDLITLTAGYSVHLPLNYPSEGLPGTSTKREESKALQPHARNQPVLPLCQTSLSELSLTSIGQSMTSDSNIRNSCSPGADLQNIYRQKPALSLAAVKTLSADGYIWRKYGQKKVKSPQGFRSYFRCAHSECCAKKIEFSDQSGCVMEIIYKSAHSHDPPRMVNRVRKSRIFKNAGSVMENNAREHSTRVLNGSNPSASSRETLMVSEGKQPDSSGFNRDAETTSRREDTLELEPKQRGKKNGVSLSSPASKPGKKPKFVVHASGDYGISSDGYKWRKYGQKMVKGNHHPRNYYRCTSAGCPARKHIETALNNVSAVIITYRGIHDHDMLSPNKIQSLPSASILAVTSPSSQGKESDLPQAQDSHTYSLSAQTLT